MAHKHTEPGREDDKEYYGKSGRHYKVSVNLWTKIVAISDRPEVKNVVEPKEG